MLRHHQHGGHAARIGHRKIAREILEHRGLAGIDTVHGEKAFVVLRQRLGLELGGDDVVHVLEMMPELEPREHRVSVAARAVGQNQLAAGQLLDRRSQRGVRLQGRVVDLMHEIQEVIGLHAVLGHQPAHRSAIALVVVLLQPEGVVVRDVEEVRDVIADALVDLVPEVQVMRIERVVEVEHPGLDPLETAPRRAAGRRQVGRGGIGGGHGVTRNSCLIELLLSP